jgi:hypothetical protein
MAARGAKGDQGLGALVRERQDLLEEWQKRDAMRIAAVSQAPDKRDKVAESTNGARLVAIDARVVEIDKRLGPNFRTTRRWRVPCHYQSRKCRPSSAPTKHWCYCSTRRNGSPLQRKPSSGSCPRRICAGFAPTSAPRRLLARWPPCAAASMRRPGPTTAPPHVLSYVQRAEMVCASIRAELMRSIRPCSARLTSFCKASTF